MKLFQHIHPRRWFDLEAEEAATFDASVFPDSKITRLRSR
jgi:predicted 3-demethylubiquinone-9 3-methyltransferase (glyoxalase superfamily)